MKAGIVLCTIIAEICMFCFTDVCIAGDFIIPAAPGLEISTPAQVTATVSDVKKSEEEKTTPVSETKTASITFNESVKKAVESSSSVIQAKAEYRKAEAVLKKQMGIFDPQLKAKISYQEEENFSQALFCPESIKELQYNAGLAAMLFTGGELSLDFSSGSAALGFPGYSGSVDASLFRPSINPYYYPEIFLAFRQPVLKGFLGGREGKKIEAAEYRIKAAGQNLKQKVLAQAYSLREAYYEIYLRDTYFKAGKNYAMDAENVYSAMKKAGNPETDLLQAKAAVIKASAFLKGMEQKLALAHEKYMDLAGYKQADFYAAVIEPQETVEDYFIPLTMTSELEETLVELQPSVTEYKFMMLSRDAEQKGESNESLPRLDIIGKMGFKGFTGSLDSAFDEIGSGKYRDFLIGAEFSWSILNNAGSGAAEESKEEQNIAVAAYENEKNLIFRVIRRAYKGITAEKAYYEAAKEARLMQETRVKLLSRAGSLVELLHAHEDRYNARKEEARAFVSYGTAVMDWNRVNGKYDFYYNEYLNKN